MSMSPVEIRHVELKRAFRGYRRQAVDSLLDDITQSFEEVWRDRADLRDKVEHLEGELARYRELENLLRTTLMTAERSASEQREQAQKEADVIVADANSTARTITADAAQERERLLAEGRRIRALLSSALTAVEEIDRPAAAA
jgi:cell division initiation protein